MLPLTEKERVRMLAAVAKRGARFQVLRVLVVTMSLSLLLAVPLTGLARVDLWGGEHALLFEKVDFITALKGVVVAIGCLWGVTFLTNIVVGRFFCGWGCPVGYVSRLGEQVDLESKSRLRKIGSHLAGAGFVATFCGSVILWWVDPLVMLHGSVTARLVVGGIFLALCFGGFAHAFVWRFGFCLHVCPIGLYYRYVTSKSPLGIVFSEEPSPCIECGVCERVCPVLIDPKRLGEEMPALSGDTDSAATRYGDAECIRCGDCVEGCEMVFSVREGETAPLRFGWTKDSTDVGATPTSTEAPPPAPTDTARSRPGP